MTHISVGGPERWIIKQFIFPLVHAFDTSYKSTLEFSRENKYFSTSKWFLFIYTEDPLSTNHCDGSWHRCRSAWCLHSQLVFRKQSSPLSLGLEPSQRGKASTDSRGMPASVSSGAMHFLSPASPSNSLSHWASLQPIMSEHSFPCQV